MICELCGETADILTAVEFADDGETHFTLEVCPFCIPKDYEVDSYAQQIFRQVMANDI